MAKPATLDGYSDQYTVDCERVLVTLLRGLGPWKDSVYLVGGRTQPDGTPWAMKAGKDKMFPEVGNLGTEAYVSHFATCSRANDFSAGRKP